MLGLAAGTMAQSLPNYVPADGLVGWWPFNGNANDESGNGNDGTVNGATLTEDRFGNTDEAYFFNGSQYIQIDQWNSITGNNPFTLSFWSKPVEGYFGWLISFGISSDGQGFECGNWNWGGGDLLGAQIWVYGSYPPAFTTIDASSWNYISISYENNLMKFYKDGIYLSEQVVDYTDVNLSAGILSFGKQLTYDEYFIGSLDDIGIWNRALTQEEITALYTATNCASDLNISPSSNALQTGSTATFTATTTDPNPSYVWQSDFGQGYVTLNNYGNYSGVNSNTLTIANVQLSAHNLPIRAISTSGECIDTSNVAIISIADTCINSFTDTSFIAVTDTLIINTLITGINPPANSNTIKVFPNPAGSFITIDYGNFALMSGYQLRIENSLGQQVYQTNITQQSDSLSLSTWGGNGLYFVHIVDPQGNTIDIRKIVLQ